MPSHSPHALRPSAFRAPGWRAPALPSPRCGRSATSWRLVPFSHSSASRIFIRQPGCIPHQWSPKTVTTSLMVGRSKSGCGLCPALSFKDLHHPCWGGGRAKLELYLPHGFVGHLLLQHSGERVLTGLAEGANFDNAGPRPGCIPHQWSPKTVTTSLMVGRSKSGCGLCPALSFKDLHHPCWGGGRAKLELYLPHGFVGHLLLQHSGERVLTGLAEGANFDNAGPSGRKRRQLPRARFAGLAGSGAPRR